MKIISRIKTEVERFFVNKCLVYITNKSENTCPNYDCGFEIKFAKSLDQVFGQGVKELSIEQEKVFENRFNNGEELCFVSDGTTVIGYGWVQPSSKSIYVWEIARTVLIPEKAIILYDFFVEKKFRGKGIYKDMLRKLIMRTDDNDKLLIYVMKNNFSSIKGIEACGFKKIGAVRFCKRKLKSMGEK